MTKNYDLIVLGTGGAGFQVAIKYRKSGKNVAVVNEGLFGGTCSVRGCIPKKLLAGVAEIADLNRRLKSVNIIKEAPEFSWTELISFKGTFTDPVPDNTKKALQEAGIDVYAGSPRFTGDREIMVGNAMLKGEKVHIAVGAKPAKLNLPGADYLITSDDFLDLEKLPKSIIFVGGGYISFEFAHIASRLGSKVTILHANDRPLPMFDKDIVDVLLKATKEAGINLVLNANVQKIEQSDDNFIVFTKDNKEYISKLAVHGAGRPPAINELSLEASNIDYDLRRGITVDEHMRSVSNPNVYAAGDVANAGPPLSPVAGVQGDIVADNLLGGNRVQPNYLSTPSVIFTTPTASSVGYQEQEAIQKGLQFDVKNTNTSQWFDSSRTLQKFSRSKVLVEKETNKILGAHLIGNHSDDLINIFSLAIELGLTTEQLKTPIMAFPTSSDDIRYMF